MFCQGTKKPNDKAIETNSKSGSNKIYFMRLKESSRFLAMRIEPNQCNRANKYMVYIILVYRNSVFLYFVEAGERKKNLSTLSLALLLLKQQNWISLAKGFMVLKCVSISYYLTRANDRGRAHCEWVFFSLTRNVRLRGQFNGVSDEWMDRMRIRWYGIGHEHFHRMEKIV